MQGNIYPRKEQIVKMPLLEGEYQKQEKINGEIYNMSPSPDYQHGIVNNNINTIIKKG